MISTVKQDEPGDGYLSPGQGNERLEASRDEGLFHLGLIEAFTGGFDVFNRIKSREGNYKTKQLLSAPQLFFRDNPLFTLALTVPTALAVMGVLFTDGSMPTTWEGMIANPIWGRSSGSTSPRT
ncbi:hypothetical protein SY89_02156 [Halolamina pelagica]|uniref:Uncharacterized protein n=1 Tax=Halolamina pelagica TaxID=699431 RepID=A0A0P7HCW8_9EURY|nr:hypothetical protein SY89_02156 [Halolamina pelagica]